MIDKALELLRSEVSTYVCEKDSSLDDSKIILDNIGMLEPSGSSSMQDHIIITLVNVEEESTLKNQSVVRRSIPQSVYHTTPVHLNLYILFTCNYTSEGYKFALQRLSHIIKFLQRKRTFSYSTFPGAVEQDFNDPEKVDLKFSVDLHTLSFEQINYLWGSLGGRQVPFAMYKLRLVALTDERIIRNVPVIEEIFTNAARQ